MKKTAIFTIIMALSLGFAGCGGNSKSETGKTTETTEEKKIDITKSTAEDIINLMGEENENISGIVVYTSETDVNKLLGRPNQYTSKINFADTRVEQLDEENPVGGSIEVFENEEDCTSRNEYLTEGYKQMPMLGTQYIYQYKNVLLRIDGDLTPDQAKEYEDGFIKLQ